MEANRESEAPKGAEPRRGRRGRPRTEKLVAGLMEQVKSEFDRDEKGTLAS